MFRHDSFHRNRVPLLIMLAGTACIGKSTLATKVRWELQCEKFVDWP
jgi:2-phosphoglycerate kinase